MANEERFKRTGECIFNEVILLFGLRVSFSPEAYREVTRSKYI